MKRYAFVLALLALPACPTEGVEDFRFFDRDRYENEVQPILAASCANPSCHGRPDRPFSLFGTRAWRENPDDVFLPTQLTDAEIEHNYTQSCAFAATGDSPESAQLLLKPLEQYAGTYHGGGVIFEGTAEEDYRVILDWVEEGWDQ